MLAALFCVARASRVLTKIPGAILKSDCVRRPGVDALAPRRPKLERKKHGMATRNEVAEPIKVSTALAAIV